MIYLTEDEQKEKEKASKKIAEKIKKLEDKEKKDGELNDKDSEDLAKLLALEETMDNEDIESMEKESSDLEKEQVDEEEKVAKEEEGSEDSEEDSKEGEASEEEVEETEEEGEGDVEGTEEMEGDGEEDLGDDEDMEEEEEDLTIIPYDEKVKLFLDMTKEFGFSNPDYKIKDGKNQIIIEGELPKDLSDSLKKLGKELDIDIEVKLEKVSKDKNEEPAKINAIMHEVFVAPNKDNLKVSLFRLF